MQIELNAEQQRILKRATKDGASVEEVLNQAFAVIEEQLDESSNLSPEELVHIEEGCAQAERGELFTPEEAKQILAELKARRHVA